ncbi:DUF1559 domain-containing protein [Schlesneria sp. T3-172]|uniref:DUF1559 domain-containing protein n=1 Tax=Schlesneria sphaerica TaxID=3373610 RepID=UPI0037C71CF2
MTRRALHFVAFVSIFLITAATAEAQVKKSPTSKEAVRDVKGELPLGRLAPIKPVFFLTTSGWKSPEAGSQNKTEQLWAQESVQAFFQQIGDEIQRLIDSKASKDETSSSLAQTLPVLLKAAVKHPLAMTLHSFTTTSAPEIEFTIIIDAEEDATDVREAFEKLIKVSSSSKGNQLGEVSISGTTFYFPNDEGYEGKQTLPHFGMSGSYLIFGYGEISAAKALEQTRAQTKSPAWLSSLLAESKIPQPTFAMHLDADLLWKTLNPVLTDEKVRGALQASGVMGIKRIASVSGLDAVAKVEKSIIETNGPPTGILAVIPEKPLALKDLKGIPVSPSNAMIFRLNLKQLAEGILKITDQVDPTIREQSNQLSREGEKMLGFSVKEDLLEALGDLWCSYVPGTDGEAGALPGFVLTVSLRDQKKMAKIQEALVLRANEFLRNIRPQAPASLQEFATRSARGYQVQLNNVVVPVTPAWVLTKDQLVFGLSPQLVTAHLAGSNKSLSDNVEVKAAMQRSPKAIHLSYRDPKPEMEALYTVFDTFSPVIRAQLQQQGIDFDIPPLPPYSDIEPFLIPSVTTVSRDSKGWSTDTHGVGSSVSVTSPATAAVVVALLLPAVQQAREAARRTQAKNNLKQIALSLYNYEEAQKRFPDRVSPDKTGKPGLSWRVKILPYLDEQELYDQFHHDEPWDSEHNKTLISRMPSTYGSPNDSDLTQQGKTRYLIVTGEGTMFGGETGPALTDVKDGLGKTIMAVEAQSDQAVVWTSPEDLELDFDDLLKGLAKARSGGFQALFGDGSVRFISENIDRQTMKALFTASGGEVLNNF